MPNKSLQWILLFSFSILLTGCEGPWYKADVQQGNIMTEQQWTQLRLGMSKKEIKDLLGSTILVASSDENHWEYQYYHQSGKGHITHKKIELQFKDNKLTHFHISPE